MGYLSFENTVAPYTPMAYFLVAHVLTLGYAVMLSALFYFAMTIRTVAPRYRISSVLSVVVMVSAFLLLYAQQDSWVRAFTLDTTTGQYALNPDNDPFTNGYRYLNWLIDVPMLLFQILFVVEISKRRLGSIRNQFFFSGPMMIVTGYIGQFYQVTNPALFYLWGTLSTIFFAHVLYLMYRLIQDSKTNLSPRAGSAMGRIWWLFLISWMLYPGAYLMPFFFGIEPNMMGEYGVVGRQITYTIADIASKVVYGVMLTRVAQIRSEEEGYVYEKLLPTDAADAAAD